MLYSVNDVKLTYDNIGNVVTFGDRSFSWSSGRYLTGIVDGTDNYSYTYDENGIRTSKTVNGVTTYYNTKDGVILSQSDGTNTFYFQYDTNGTPFGFIYNDVQYFYITNPLGDVIFITKSNGEIICEYEYDEWGQVLNLYLVDEENAEQLALANANPIRYRGYYYDTETEYYYLQSRYYDPSICRFINSDVPEIAQMEKDVAVGTNLFAYCNNDPVDNSDPTGNLPNILAWGIQFNISIKKLNFGIEVLRSTSQKKWYVFVYFGSGHSSPSNSSVNSCINSILKILKSSKSISSKLFSKTGITVSAIVVFGNKKVTFPADYCGWFTGISGTIKHISFSGALAASGKKRIGSLGLGISTTRLGLGFSKVYYFQVTGKDKLINNIKAFHASLKDIASPLVCLAFLIG